MFCAGHHYDMPVNQCTPAAQVSIFLGVVCSVIMGVSRRAGDLIMGLVFVIIQLVSTKHDDMVDPIQARTLKEIPKTIHAALSKFNLEGKTTIYAVCPACHFTHKPRVQSSSFERVYPEHCAHHPKPGGGQCKEPLLHNARKGNGRARQPIKPFAYHHFVDYLAGLLSQHKDVMDKAVNDCFQSLNSLAPELIKGVFDANFIRSFDGPTPKTLFIE
jgi:hypothetical protein